MPITLKEARKIVEQYLSKYDDDDQELVITHTVEKSFGWIFYYDTKAYVETGDDFEALLGNNPYLVQQSHRPGKNHQSTNITYLSCKKIAIVRLAIKIIGYPN